MTSVRLPGLIDVHVHLREPGATQKENFLTGTQAAVAGGFTFVLDMPNNPAPTISIDRLKEKIRLADEKAVCDVGFHYGTDGRNLATFAEAAGNYRVYGLKIYANHTTGDLLIEDPATLEAIFAAWQSPKPILVHAEKERLALMIDLARHFGRHLHVCHISRADEVDLVRQAKQTGLSISAGVCPHHLFMVDDAATQAMGGYARMKPPLGTKEDQVALWAGIADGIIDLVETDHAPHTKEEKESDSPLFGVPGLETAALLLFKAQKDGRLESGDIKRLLYDNPKRIFSIPDQPETFVEFAIDGDEVIGANGYRTKAGWSPFEEWRVPARLARVVWHGQELAVQP
jgi:carbamoyl-phosphate synthase/aspartate carbamoyltransferase/dihydroorotase